MISIIIQLAFSGRAICVVINSYMSRAFIITKLSKLHFLNYFNDVYTKETDYVVLDTHYI